MRDSFWGSQLYLCILVVVMRLLLLSSSTRWSEKMQLLETNVEKIRGVAKVGGNEGKKVKPTAKGKGKKTAKDVGEDEDEGDDDAQEELGKSGKAESGVRSAKRSGGVKKEKEVKAKGKPRRVKKEKEEGAACASHGEEE